MIQGTILSHLYIFLFTLLKTLSTKTISTIDIEKKIVKNKIFVKMKNLLLIFRLNYLVKNIFSWINILYI